MKQFPTPIFDDAHDEREAQAKAKAERTEALRLKVRESFPQITEFADEMRALFPGTRIVWAMEGGNRIGNVPADELQNFEAKYGPTKDITKE